MRDLRKHMAWYLMGFPVGADLRRAFATVSRLTELQDLIGQLDPTAPFPRDAEGPPGFAGQGRTATRLARRSRSARRRRSDAQRRLTPPIRHHPKHAGGIADFVPSWPAVAKSLSLAESVMPVETAVVADSQASKTKSEVRWWVTIGTGMCPGPEVVPRGSAIPRRMTLNQTAPGRPGDRDIPKAPRRPAQHRSRCRISSRRSTTNEAAESAGQQRRARAISRRRAARPANAAQRRNTVEKRGAVKKRAVQKHSAATPRSAPRHHHHAVGPSNGATQHSAAKQRNAAQRPSAAHRHRAGTRPNAARQHAVRQHPAVHRNSAVRPHRAVAPTDAQPAGPRTRHRPQLVPPHTPRVRPPRAHRRAHLATPRRQRAPQPRAVPRTAPPAPPLSSTTSPAGSPCPAEPSRAGAAQ